MTIDPDQTPRPSVCRCGNRLCLSAIITVVGVAATALALDQQESPQHDQQHHESERALRHDPAGWGVLPMPRFTMPHMDGTEDEPSPDVLRDDPPMPIGSPQASVEVWNSIPPDYDGEVQNAANFTFWAISPNGQHIVGTVSEQNVDYPDSNGLQRLEAFILTNGVMRVLGQSDDLLPITVPSGVTDDGHVIGMQLIDRNPTRLRPVVWTPDRQIHPLPTNTDMGFAYGVDSSASVITGAERIDSDQISFRASAWVRSGDGVYQQIALPFIGMRNACGSWLNLSNAIATTSNGQHIFGFSTRPDHCTGACPETCPAMWYDLSDVVIPPFVGEQTRGSDLIFSKPISARGNRLVYSTSYSNCTGDPNMVILNSNGIAIPFEVSGGRQFWMSRSGGTIVYGSATNQNSCFGGSQSGVYDDVHGHRNLLTMLADEYGVSAGSLHTARGISGDGKTIIGTNKTYCYNLPFLTLGSSSWIIHLDHAPCAAPWFEQDPADGLAEVGEQLVFEAVVAGDGPIEVYWKKDGEAISDGVTPHGSIIAGTGTTTLTIDNFQEEDQGEYQIIASGPCGELHSYLATAQVGTQCAGPADLNCDGVVDALDLLILLSEWGECADPSPGNCPADINGDGTVDALDLLELLSNWG